MNIKALLLNKQALLAVAMIALVATAGFLGTRAFFSDTETSTANVFAAGSLDLEVGVWDAGDEDNFMPQSIPGNQALFAFSNLIPGDTGTGRFLLESSQDAWLCVAGDVTAEDDNTRLDVETAAGDTTPNAGELGQFMQIAIWQDNGNADGVVGSGEKDSLQAMSLYDFANGDYHSVQDSTNGSNPLVAGQRNDQEFAYCFGEFDNVGQIKNNGGTLECNGATASNVAQTDSVETTIHFYAEQMQSNENFVCSSMNPAPAPTPSGINEISRLYSNGNVDETFNTIQEAINDSGTVAGDTIYVPAGTYNEDVTIDKEITLQGAGQDSTTINGQSGDYAIEINSPIDDVTISGFTVNGNGAQEALKIAEGQANDNFTVEDNTFVSGNGGHAVYAGGLTNSDFNNNTFTIASGANPVILVYIAGSGENVNFDGNTFSGDLGAHLAFGSVATDSVFKNNDFTAITAASKDKLVEFIATTADASAGGNVYPVISGNEWSTVNGGANDFKGVYRGTTEIDAHSNGSDTVTEVN